MYVCHSIGWNFFPFSIGTDAASIGTDCKAVNREDKLSRRYRGRDLAKFERSRRYRER
jgi:hypothetical protein